MVSCPSRRQLLLINTALHVPLAAANLQPEAGRKNDTENGQKMVFLLSFRWLVPVDSMGKRQCGRDFLFCSGMGIQGAGLEVVGKERPKVI